MEHHICSTYVDGCAAEIAGLTVIGCFGLPMFGDRHGEEKKELQQNCCAVSERNRYDRLGQVVFKETKRKQEKKKEGISTKCCRRKTSNPVSINSADITPT